MEEKKKNFDGQKVVLTVILLLLTAGLFLAIGFQMGKTTVETTSTATVTATATGAIRSATATATTSATNTTANWKTYTSDRFGFSFKYPNNYVLGDSPKVDDIVITADKGGHWVYDVSIPDEANNQTIEQLADNMISHLTAGVTNDAGAKLESTKSNITVGGEPAIKYSIKNAGDYGNAGAVLIRGDNVIYIKGDDSSTESKVNFDRLLSTFQFTPVK